ncbi:MAG: lipopolysaccharide heptosyltransferase I [Pseudomonadales bacterium]|nr:lipopolysaccharide heptosyltransferase I [Pseudomonadales bacterium]
MRVLIIKTSSIGDLVNTLPAMTDATQMIPGIRFDWLVDESLQEIPQWHYATERVIPVATHDLSKNLWGNLIKGKWWRMKHQIRTNDYFAILDSDGLWMNGWLSRYANGPTFGLDKESARDQLATRYYDHTVAVAKGQHAVERVRQFFAKALGYDFPRAVANSGIKLDSEPSAQSIALTNGNDPCLMFFCGASWETKLWPVAYWQTAAKLAGRKGYRVLIPWRYENERAIADEIAKVGKHVEVFQRSSLTELAHTLNKCHGVVAVDTGLTHLAAALSIPCVSLYGPTDPGLSGAFGQNQVHLFANYSCSPCLKDKCTYSGPKVKNQLNYGQGEYVEPPCFSSLMPGYVFDVLQQQIEVKFGAPVKIAAVAN